MNPRLDGGNARINEQDIPLKHLAYSLSVTSKFEILPRFAWDRREKD
jgi:hypothetical protein